MPSLLFRKHCQRCIIQYCHVLSVSPFPPKSKYKKTNTCNHLPSADGGCDVTIKKIAIASCFYGSLKIGKRQNNYFYLKTSFRFLNMTLTERSVFYFLIIQHTIVTRYSFQFSTQKGKDLSFKNLFTGGVPRMNWCQLFVGSSSAHQSNIFDIINHACV